MSRSPLSLTSMPRSLLSFTCTLPELPPLHPWPLPPWLTPLPLPWPLPPLHTPVTTTAPLPVRTLTTLSPLPSLPLPRNREFIAEDTLDNTFQDFIQIRNRTNTQQVTKQGFHRQF